jgi:hypothetical protein
MFKLNLSLLAWDTDAFNATFIEEICVLDENTLPLQQGLSQSSYANSDNLTASVLSKKSNGNCLLIKAGLFYTGIIAGCNCADDPTPVDENNEYCEVLFTIDKKTAVSSVSLIS